MVYDAIHKEAVVAHHYHTSREILKILLKHAQRGNIEVIGGLIEYEEIRVTHEHRTKIELSPLATAELRNIVVLLLRGEEKMLKQLGGCKMPPSS